MAYFTSFSKKLRSLEFVRSIYLGITTTFMDLPIAEAYRGQGYGSYLAKSVVNQLIAQNDKSFQIAVEDSNIGAKRLYEKIGFVKQTQVVYLKQKE